MFEHELSFADAKKQALRSYLIQVLLAHGGNVSAAAKAAQLSRQTMIRQCRTHQVNPALFRALGALKGDA